MTKKPIAPIAGPLPFPPIILNDDQQAAPVMGVGTGFPCLDRQIRQEHDNNNEKNNTDD